MILTLTGSVRLLLWVLTALGSLLALVIAFALQGRAGFKTTLFVLQVLQTPVKPQSWFTKEAIREVVYYPGSLGMSEAQVYRPPNARPNAAVALCLGVANFGFDDPDAINLGNALARAGIVVMYHWSPGMGLHFKIDPDQIDDIVRAFMYLETQSYVDPARVGLGGFCVGASFALVAAADVRIRDRIVVVNAFGPYFDAETLVLEAASREVVFEGGPSRWDPDELTTRVLANEYIETLDRPSEADILGRKYLADEPVTAEELSELSQDALEIIQLLEGVELSKAREIYERFPDKFHRDIRRISPSRYISDVRARLLVMHDRDDRVVPAAESRRLYEAVRDRSDARFTEFVAFEHMTPRDDGIVVFFRQAARLYRHMSDLIRIAT